MAENILILVPKFFDAIPVDCDALIATLHEKRFIGDAIEINGAVHYRPGEEFMMLVTFLGCSPMIATEELDNSSEQFCHIAIEGPWEQPRFLAGANIKIPRCPNCGHRYDEWQAMVDRWRADPYAMVSCPACGDNTAAPQLRWRKCAGFGRFFIKVWGIFESEAVPSPNLISLLQRVTGIDWQHFYIRNQ